MKKLTVQNNLKNKLKIKITLKITLKINKIKEEKVQILSIKLILKIREINPIYVQKDNHHNVKEITHKKLNHTRYKFVYNKKNRNLTHKINLNYRTIIIILKSIR